MAEYWRFHVRLLDVDANLWRRFLLKKTATFEHLHHAIQDACGWQNYHMFAFRSPDRRETIAGIPDDDGFGPPDPNAEVVKLSSIFAGNAPESCIYEYDFGDSWMHEVTCVGVEKHAERFVRRLLDGAGTFPPEDCGSSYGYGRCVAAATGKGWIKDYGDTEEKKELLEWLGEWRPDSFNLAKYKEHFDT